MFNVCSYIYSYLLYSYSIAFSNLYTLLKVVNSSEHSVKGYADDVTLVSDNFDVHVSVLQTVDRRACDLDLSFKPVKCVLYLFDGSKCLQKGIVLSKGVTRSITEGVADN